MTRVVVDRYVFADTDVQAAWDAYCESGGMLWPYSARILVALKAIDSKLTASDLNSPSIQAESSEP